VLLLYPLNSNYKPPDFTGGFFRCPVFNKNSLHRFGISVIRSHCSHRRRSHIDTAYPALPAAQTHTAIMKQAGKFPGSGLRLTIKLPSILGNFRRCISFYIATPHLQQPFMVLLQKRYDDFPVIVFVRIHQRINRQKSF
jgi:hypothetical protein